MNEGNFYPETSDFDLLDPQILEFWKQDAIASGAIGLAVFYDGQEHYCFGYDNTDERDEIIGFYGLYNYLAGMITF